MTRFATLPCAPARALLLLLCALMAYGLTLSPAAPPHLASDPLHNDPGLYRAIAADVAAGDGYYAAASREQRLRFYPLRPFVTVRLPTLAWLTAGVGGERHAVWLLRLLALAAVAATSWRLRTATRSTPLWIAATMMTAMAIGVLVQPAMVVWHDLWAGLLVALALACRSERHWQASLVFAVLAVLVRELALPLIVAMLAGAAWQRRRGEAIGWAAALLLVLALIALHAHAVAAVVRPGDAASPGWSGFGGWRFDLALARGSSLLAILPPWGAALLVPVALLGWVGWPGAGRTALTLAGWLGAFLLIGRADNVSWGLLLAPLLPIGIVLAAPALRDLVAAAGRRG